jgi:hypothetical protein
MTDIAKTPEQLAADRLAQAIVNQINGCTGQQVAISSFAMANRSEGTIQGLIRLLVHKGILSRAELGDSIAWALDARACELNANADKGSILLPTAAPHARNSN